MKILITGGAGYVGTTLIPMLLDRGDEVTVFDNLMYGGAALLPFFRNDRFSFIRGDVRDQDAVNKACAGADAIFHLAAIVGFPACRKDPGLAETVNVDGSKCVANAVSKSQFVVYASTGSNYGALVDAVCTEETPLNPLSVYGKTKTNGESYLRDNASCVAFRYATAFGLAPRMRLDLLVNEFTYQAVTQNYLVVYESHFMRTFIHVVDIARSFVFALDNMDATRGEVFNVGSETMNHSKRELVEMIREFTDAYIHYADVGSDADQRNYVVSYDKITNAGYTTTINLKEGIEELVKSVPAIRVANPFSNA